MPNTISSLAIIVRSLVSLAIFGLLGIGGWITYQMYDERAQVDRELREKTAQLTEMTAQVDRLTKENQKLDLALRLLKIDHRVAEITVLDRNEEQGRPRTKFQFVELSKDGSPLGEKKVFTVEGDTIYVDAWVIKYSDALVEGGDPLRSTSVCLFRRIFGEHQEPSEGFPLDAAGSRPSVYSQGNEMSPLERDIWTNFWEYANSPVKAKQAGLRAAHGEAPSIRLELGKRYRVELRASAGLSIIAEDLPPGAAG
jgi:type II secretory pathway pseudopilin PulG